MIKTYKSCSEIPIYNFMMCLSTMNFTFLISNAKKVSKDKVNKFVEEKKDYLKGIFEEIEVEYKGLTFSKHELEKQKALASMIYMEAKHNAIVKVLNLYISTNEIAVLELLNSLGLKFDKKKPIAPQLKLAERATVGLRNKINIKTANFKIKYKISEADLKNEIDDNSADIEKSLDSQALSIEANLETGYHIDIKKTSVLRWVNLTEANQRKIELLNK